MDDFLRWYGSAIPEEAQTPSESLPPGVPAMSSRYGTFGSNAVLGVTRAHKERQPACPDAEAQPSPPCANTQECNGLLALARDFQSNSVKARKLTQEAVSSLVASQVLLQLARKGAAAMLSSPSFCHISADEGPGPSGSFNPHNLIVKMLSDPLGDSHQLRSDHNHEEVLERLMERWDFDKRTAEYLGQAEASATFPQADTLVAAPGIEPLQMIVAEVPVGATLMVSAITRRYPHLATVITPQYAMCMSRTAISWRRFRYHNSLNEFLGPGAE